MQTYETILTLVERVSYPFRGFRVGVVPEGHSDPHGYFLQVEYEEADVTQPDTLALQRGRKWYVSRHATDSEVFQTMLAAALASAEHQVREHFAVDGQTIYGPHMDANELVALLAARDATDARAAA